jgi:hypothetical protein
VISGLPATSGTSTFTVTVVDTGPPGQQASNSLTITVGPAPTSTTVPAQPAAATAVTPHFTG